VQGCSTNYVVGAHRNRIVPHQIATTLQGNAWPMCSASKLSHSGQTKKGCSQLYNQCRINGLSPGDQLYHVREKIGSCVIQAFSKFSRWKILNIPNLKWWGPHGQAIPYAFLNQLYVRRQESETGLRCSGCKLLWKFGYELHHCRCCHLPCNKINVYVEIPLNHHPWL
jgi:hypothetical protein